MKRLLLVLLSFAFLSAGLHAQCPVKTTRILAILTIKPGVQRSEFAKLMPDEVKATVRLYLEGKISEWYARGDGKGVVLHAGAQQLLNGLKHRSAPADTAAG